MTFDVKHAMVEYKALSNPPNPLQIHGSKANLVTKTSCINTIFLETQKKKNSLTCIFGQFSLSGAQEKLFAFRKTDNVR